MTEKKLVEVYGLFAEWYINESPKLNGGKNLRQLGTVFTHTFPKRHHRRFGSHKWQVAVNGMDTDLNDPIGNSTIKPFNMHLYRDGWLVCIATPFEGEVIANSELLHGMDKEFIWLLKRLLRKQKKKLNESVSKD